MQTLSFPEEAKRFLAQMNTLRSLDDCQLIEKYSRSIECGAARMFVAIPCHVREAGLFESLAAYAGSGADQTCMFLVYLNANSSTAKDEFEMLLQRRQLELARAQEQFPQMRILSLSHHFSSKVLVSRVKGLITDAIIKACYEQAVEDPIIVANDADALYYSSDYLTKIKDCFAAFSELDYLSGQIYWSGCDEKGRVRYRPVLALPEIYLNDLLGQEADELYRDNGVVYTTGCNSAFRLASLCAINAYDYDFAPFFDVEIGMVLNRFRKSRNPEADLKQFARFLPDCILATNPRRAIHALLANIPYGQQFDSVASVLGADLSLAEYTNAYLQSNCFIQADELLRYHEEPSSREKINSRLIHSFLDFVAGEPTSNKKILAELLSKKIGLEIESINSDGLELKSIKFNWTKSGLAQRLVKWIESIQPPSVD